MSELTGQPETNRALADEVIDTATPAEHASLIVARANLSTTDMARQLGEAIDWARESLEPWTETFARAYRGAITASRRGARRYAGYVAYGSERAAR